jgi:hypothetical protein
MQIFRPGNRIDEIGEQDNLCRSVGQRSAPGNYLLIKSRSYIILSLLFATTIWYSPADNQIVLLKIFSKPLLI